jgi:hypothetical protein
VVVRRWESGERERDRCSACGILGRSSPPLRGLAGLSPELKRSWLEGLIGSFMPSAGARYRDVSVRRIEGDGRPRWRLGDDYTEWRCVNCGSLHPPPARIGSRAPEL